MRHLGWIVCGTLALAACSSSGDRGRADGGGAGTGGAGTGGAGTGGAQPDAGPATKTYTFQTTINRDVDLLVMVDNSLSMKSLQTKFTAAFPRLFEVLQSMPGGLPNLHLGVVSSDLGAGPYTAVDIPSCRTGGDMGAFQTAQKGTTCAGGSLMPGQNFIIASNSGSNYTGSLAETFACIAPLGDLGCGFEHQLASVLRALGADGSPPPPTNANFLRPNAYLYVLLLTNEDDCSAPPDSMLFDPTSRFVSDPLGPLSSFRCNEFGHTCGGKAPPRQPVSAMGDDLGTCMSTEDGKLLKVSDVAARLKALKPDPSKVFVAAIAGPPTPYVVETGPATLKDDPNQLWPQIRHSCVQQTTMGVAPEYADPAVRISQLVKAFGDNGLFQVICNNTLDQSLMAVGKHIGTAISAPCLDAGTNPTKCTATQHKTNDQGMRVDTPLPACSASAMSPCWDTRSVPACGQRLFFDLHLPAAPAAGEYTTVTCPVAP